MIAGSACRSSGADAAASAASAPVVAIAQPSKVVQLRAAHARQAPVFRRGAAWRRAPRAGVCPVLVTSYRSSLVSPHAAGPGSPAGRRRKRQMIQYINLIRQGFDSLSYRPARLQRQVELVALRPVTCREREHPRTRMPAARLVEAAHNLARGAPQRGRKSVAR
ncbi:hypothetical protein EGT41_05430 [Burkholderia cenocepacia]|uniref:Uncharacterized protein n=2 Tax=Burkholderia cenocepacia TaxID=95486 RepID=A0A3N9F234_9BURK|nr:hypothetical protein DF042_21270 [Burkholderia cenocepacia]RSC12833.1 hypothetical protein EGT41_05430 [Burkholderia cenocepacia]